MIPPFIFLLLQINLLGDAEYAGHISVHVRQRFLEKCCVRGKSIYTPCHTMSKSQNAMKRIAYLKIQNQFEAQATQWSHDPGYRKRHPHLNEKR